MRPIFSLIHPERNTARRNAGRRRNSVLAAKDIQSRTNCLWLIFGGKNDAPTADQIGKEINHTKPRRQDLAARTDGAAQALPRPADK